MDTQEILKLKYSIPFLHELTKEEVNDLLKIASVRIFHPNQVIFREGDDADGMYIVLKGEVKIEKRILEGDVLVLGKLMVGDVFGEMALIEDTVRSATAKTTDAGATLFFIGASGFLRFRKMYHPASMKILKQFAFILAERALRIERLITEFYENADKSIKILEKLYLKHIEHPNYENYRKGLS